MDRSHWGQVPDCVFGHTLNHTGANLVLFGGFHPATSANSSSNSNYASISSSASAASLSLNNLQTARPSNSVYSLDLDTLEWKLINVRGLYPSPRGGHAAAVVNSRLAVFGGTNGVTLASSDMFILEEMSNYWQWILLDVQQGPRPAARYGHTMVYSAPNMVLFGGSSGLNDRARSDLWIMRIDCEELCWEQVVAAGPTPAPRMSHCAAVRDDGLIVVFGGVGTKGVAFDDMTGLRFVRGKSWIWAKPPQNIGANPVGRCNHVAVFLGSRMVVHGGTSDGYNVLVDIPIYDSSASRWTTATASNLSVGWSARVRHAACVARGKLFIFGGLDRLKARNDLICTDLLAGDLAWQKHSNSNAPRITFAAATTTTSSSPPQPPASLDIRRSLSPSSPSLQSNVRFFDLPFNYAPAVAAASEQQEQELSQQDEPAAPSSSSKPHTPISYPNLNLKAMSPQQYEQHFTSQVTGKESLWVQTQRRLLEEMRLEEARKQQREANRDDAKKKSGRIWRGDKWSTSSAEVAMGLSKVRGRPSDFWDEGHMDDGKEVLRRLEIAQKGNNGEVWNGGCGRPGCMESCCVASRPSNVHFSAV